MRIAAQELIANEAYDATDDIKHMAIDMAVNIATAKLASLGKGLEAGSQAAKSAQTMQRMGNAGAAMGGAAAHSLVDGGDGGGAILRAGIGAVLPGYFRGKAENAIKGTTRGANVAREGFGTLVDTATNVVIGGGHIDGGTAIDLIGGTVQGRLHGGQQHRARSPGDDSHLPLHERTTRPMPAVDVDSHRTHEIDVPAYARTTDRMTAVALPSEPAAQSTERAKPASERTTQPMEAVVPPSERVTEKMTAVDPDAIAYERAQKRAWERAAEPQRDRPTSYVEAIERSTGIDKGAEHDRFRQEAPDFYAKRDKEIAAIPVTNVRGDSFEHRQDGELWHTVGDYDVRRIPYDNKTISSVTLDTHLRPGAGITPQDIEAARQSAYRGVDDVWNRDRNGDRHVLSDGSLLQVEPNFIDQPTRGSQVVDLMHPTRGPDGMFRRSNESQWYTNDLKNPLVPAHEYGHRMRLRDEYFDPESVWRAHHESPFIAKDGGLMQSVAPGATVKPRYLEQISDDIAKASTSQPTATAEVTSKGRPPSSPEEIAFGHFAEDAAPSQAKQRPDEQSLAQAIADVPIHRLPPPKEGEAPPSGHPDTYYVSPADGARMQQMLELQEGTRVRVYEKGFIARRGGEEWYFEVRDTAGLDPVKRSNNADATDTKGDNRTPDGDVAPAMREDGMPAPNAATVEVWGFRGVRNIEGKERPDWSADDHALVREMSAQEPLLYAGHIGISTDGGESIQGYTPKRSPELSMSALKAHEAFPGNVLDDTQVFELATQMAAKHGWNTRPVSAVQLVDPEVKRGIIREMQRLQSATPEQHGLAYSFPLGYQQDGSYFKESNGYPANCVDNCATFPERVGVKIPERSGNLNSYMPALTRWAEEDGPIDLRTQPTQGGEALTKKDEETP